MSAHLQVKVTDELHKKIKIAAAQNEVSIGQFLKDALEGALTTGQVPTEKEKQNEQEH